MKSCNLRIPRIFEMFTQVDTSLERSVGSLEIGLTLVKRLVEMHGGRVEGSSEAGRTYRPHETVDRIFARDCITVLARYWLDLTSPIVVVTPRFAVLFTNDMGRFMGENDLRSTR